MKAWIVRFILLIVWTFLVLWGTSDPFYTNYPPAASPFLFLVRLIGGSLTLIAAFVPVIMILGILWKKRFFCRYCCPMGSLFDLARSGNKKLLRRKGIQFSFRFSAVGRILLFLVLIGTALGLPFLTRWMMLDPLVLFRSFFDPGYDLFILAVVLLAHEFIFPRLWCGIGCPLGALQDILFRWRTILARSRSFDKSEANPKVDSERRFVFRAIAGTILSFVVLAPLATISAFVPKRLRPPGALEEPRFSTLCSACGRCISACPNKHLVPIVSDSLEMDPEKKIESRSLCFDLTPTIETEKTYCEKDCIACGQVCPTGAIRSFDISEKGQMKTGLAVYDFDHCVLYMEKECNICIRECPWDAITSVWSEDLMIGLPTVDPDLCTGCGRCVVECPGFDPIYHGEEEGEEKTENALSLPKAFKIKSLE